MVSLNVRPDVLGVSFPVYVAAFDFNRRFCNRVDENSIRVSGCNRAGIVDRFICADINGDMTVYVVMDVDRLV